ncbi:hypothetical protein [Lacinutrix undariae]
MNKKIATILMLSVGLCGYAQQNKSVAEFNYKLTPAGTDDISLQNTNIYIEVPTNVGTGVMTHSFNGDYNLYDYTAAQYFNTESLNSFYNLKYQLEYKYPLTSSFNIHAQANVAIMSILNKSLSSNDLFFGGGLYISKNYSLGDKPSVLKLGISYSAITGEPTYLPIISYEKIVSDRFSYKIGFPETEITYGLSEMSQVKLNLETNGYYANLSQPLYVSVNDVAEKAKISSTTLGLQYNYKMDKSWSIKLCAEYALKNSYKLENNNNTVYDFDVATKPTFSTGIIYNLK